MYKSKFKLVFTIVLVAVFLFQCDQLDDDESSNDNENFSCSNLVLTDEAGPEVIDMRGDPADQWLIINNDSGSDIPTEIEVHPAYPNPTDTTAQLSFSLPKAMNVKIEMMSEGRDFFKILLDEQLSAGSYNTTISSSDFPNESTCLKVDFYFDGAETPKVYGLIELIILD